MKVEKVVWRTHAERSKAPDWGRGPVVSSTLSSISPTGFVLTHLRFLHGGLLSFRLGQHYPTTPAQPTSAHSSPPQSCCRNPSRGTPIHWGRRVVSCWTRPAFASALLSSLNGADSPFLCTISEAVWQWGASSASQIQRDPLCPSVYFKLLPFQAPMRTKKSNLPHREGGGEFTVTLGCKRGNIEEKSVTDWDTVTVQCSALNPCSSTGTLFHHTEEDSSETCHSWTLNSDENLVLSKSPLRHIYTTLKWGGYAYMASEWPFQWST